MTRPKITMTLLVRNEQDIIAENIRFHHALGVDSFIVMDNLSTDATADIVKALAQEIDIEYLHQPRDDYNQWEWVTEMARKAATDHGADWVINNDADEFWVPRQGDLTSYLSGLPPETGAVLAQRHNGVVICPAGAPLEGSCAPETCSVFERGSTNNLGKPLPGKVLHRACATVTVAQGNHAVSDMPGRTEAAGDGLRILHYPYRSLAHYKEKIRLGGAAYKRNTELPQGVGATWRAHFEGLETGVVDRFWTDLSLTLEEVEIGLLSGSLMRDERVSGFYTARARQAGQRQLQAARARLLDQTRTLVEEFKASQAYMISRAARHLRKNRPMYYNLRFAINSAEAHLDALEKLTVPEDSGQICGDLAALRDAFSLFPRNGALRGFLGDLLALACPAQAERLRRDCAGKRVILHTSCHPRLTATQETIASFAPLDGEYHHIILLGAPNGASPSEDDTPLGFAYDGQILQVPSPDNYESLHRKLFYAYMLFDLLTEPELLVKIDDNILLKDAPAFASCIDDVAGQGAEYAGRRVGSQRHDSQWHGWHIGKCADPLIEARGYQYPLPRDYAAGGHGYVLGPKGLAACSYMYLAMKEFFIMRAVGLEDACVGHAAYAQELELLDLSNLQNQLTLQGLTTKERERLVQARPDTPPDV